MRNIYFTSSPLHFYISCVIALNKEDHEQELIFFAKSPQAAILHKGLTDIAENIFSVVHFIGLQTGEAHYSRRKSLAKLKKIVSTRSVSIIYTGNDRWVEFQYAMQLCRKNGFVTKGAYMDDGLVSYLGQKSMSSYSYRYIYPMLRKIAYGHWYNNPTTNGASSWINDVHLIYPELAHRHLDNKTKHSIHISEASQDKLQTLFRKALEDRGVMHETLLKKKFALVFPHEQFYLSNPSLLKLLSNRAFRDYNQSEIALKLHPRSKNTAIIDEYFGDVDVLPLDTGIEMLIPFFAAGSTLVGSTSSALLTTKWLRNDIKVELLPFESRRDKQAEVFFRKIGIFKAT